MSDSNQVEVCIMKFVIAENFTVPRGAIIGCLIREFHTDKNYWGEDASDFKPERFSEDNFKKVNPNAYMPFSRGPRMCPGHRYASLTTKVFLSKFLARYRVTTELKLEELEYQVALTTRLKQGFLLKVERR